MRENIRGDSAVDRRETASGFVPAQRLAIACRARQRGVRDAVDRLRTDYRARLRVVAVSSRFGACGVWRLRRSAPALFGPRVVRQFTVPRYYRYLHETRMPRLV